MAVEAVADSEVVVADLEVEEEAAAVASAVTEVAEAEGLVATEMAEVEGSAATGEEVVVSVLKGEEEAAAASAATEEEEEVVVASAVTGEVATGALVVTDQGGSPEWTSKTAATRTAYGSLASFNAHVIFSFLYYILYTPKALENEG